MDGYFDLNPQTYDWCARAFEQVRKVLGVRIKMHHERGQIDGGSIFLFNHFARVETFIPQYLIYQENGEFCRSIAASQFFEGSDRFASVLRDLGVVPNKHPQLMQLLAIDILKGRKVVVFPEGGMVKDRQVVDQQGRYSIYSRHAQERRKHHTGAGRLAIGLRIFQRAVEKRHAQGDIVTLQRWARECHLGTSDALLEAVRRPVNLVPANITFYPLRIGDNILRRGAEMLTGGLSMRAVDELVVEGNILLKATDMDINLAPSQPIARLFKWYEQAYVEHIARDLPDLGAIFDIEWLRRRAMRRLATGGVNRVIVRVRDNYMRAIYSAAAVNLSHLASSIILSELEQGNSRIETPLFRRALYLSTKALQARSEIRLHRGLCDPDRYQLVLESEPSALTEFLDSAASADLIRHDDTQIEFLEKLAEQHHFDAIRLENPIEVYGNEVEPLAAVGRAVKSALGEARHLESQALSRELFDDELKSLEWDRARFDKRKHYEINQRETATADSRPQLLEPMAPRPLGVVLVHGFLASPAEVSEFGHKLRDAGYATVIVRLKGHGTSPWDLRERSWKDWLDSVERGRRIISGLAPRCALVGFSTGGSLAMRLAIDRPDDIAGVCAIAPPIRFRNRNMRFVPIMHGANRVVRWLSSYEGVMPFRVNDSEHPHINYRHMPLRGLYELTRLAADLKRHLPQLSCPLCLIQGTRDSVVDPKSAEIAYDKARSETKELHWVESNRHGILNENIGQTHQHAMAFLERLSEETDESRPA